MSNTLRKVDYFYVMLPNRAGQGAKVMAALAAEGVNLLAFSGFPSGGKAQLDLMPEDSARFRKAAKKLGLKLSQAQERLPVPGRRSRRRDDEDSRQARGGEDQRDRPSMRSTSGKGRFGAIFWVKPTAVAKAAKVLGARRTRALRVESSGAGDRSATGTPAPPSGSPDDRRDFEGRGQVGAQAARRTSPRWASPRRPGARRSAGRRPARSSRGRRFPRRSADRRSGNAPCGADR